MPVLGTKLHAPSPRRELVPRPRLLDQLRSGASPRMVLVCAPAGFGKTTLLTQWLTNAADADGGSSVEEVPPLSVCWLSLDAGDADPRRFLTHLITSVQTTAPDVGVDALAMLDSDRGVPSEEVLVGLVNDLDAYVGPTVLALDDYHVIDTPAVHDTVTSPARHPPAQCAPVQRALTGGPPRSGWYAAAPRW